MKNVKFIAVMLVLLLGLMGGAYAAWGDELVVSGSVETGTVDVEFTDFNVVYDVVANTKDGEEVAIVTIEPGECNNPKELVFTVTNAYPQFEAWIEFTVHNKGSIPVKLQSIEIHPEYPEGEFLILNSPPFLPPGWCQEHELPKSQCPCNDNNDNNDVPDLEVGTQLNTCETADGSIYVKVSPDCEGVQGYTYTFTVTYEFIQWNKFVPEPEC